MIIKRETTLRATAVFRVFNLTMEDGWINLEEFFEDVLERVQGDNTDEVDNVIEALFTENPNWKWLVLDAVLNGEIEERILNRLVASDKIRCLSIPPNTEPNFAEEMLRHSVPVMSNLDCIIIRIPLTETQAERLFSILCACSSLDTVGFHVGDTGIAKPLVKYLRESLKLKRLGLTWSEIN